jgi:DNA invertase Pin-like site-specific DNA recombinase
MTQAYGYLRVSGKGQINGDGPERQELAIRRYASEHGIELVKVYFEQGVCGEVETMERPAFMAMIGDLGDIRTVIVEKLDRLSRHLITQETCIQDFTKQGIALLSCDPAEFELMASDPGRVLVRQVFGAIAQYDKAIIVAKLMAARKRMRVATGRCEGQKPYGARPGEQQTIDYVVSLRADGLVCDRIALILNAESVQTRKTGGKWYGRTVRNLLDRYDSVESLKSTPIDSLATQVNATASHNGSLSVTV